jgi:hypothetical protein
MVPMVVDGMMELLCLGGALGGLVARRLSVECRANETSFLLLELALQCLPGTPESSRVREGCICDADAVGKGSLPCQTHLVNGELRLGGALGGVKEKLLISANRFAIEVGRMTLGT